MSTHTHTHTRTHTPTHPYPHPPVLAPHTLLSIGHYGTTEWHLRTAGWVATAGTGRQGPPPAPFTRTVLALRAADRDELLVAPAAGAGAVAVVVAEGVAVAVVVVDEWMFS